MDTTFDCEKGYSYTINPISRRIPLEGMTLREFLELIVKQGRLLLVWYFQHHF